MRPGRHDPFNEKKKKKVESGSGGIKKSVLYTQGKSGERKKNHDASQIRKKRGEIVKKDEKKLQGRTATALEAAKSCKKGEALLREQYRPSKREPDGIHVNKERLHFLAEKEGRVNDDS